MHRRVYEHVFIFAENIDMHHQNLEWGVTKIVLFLKKHQLRSKLSQTGQQI